MTSIYFANEASQFMKDHIVYEKGLIQAALRFEQEALAQIYDLYSPELYRYAVRLLSDPTVAEDCVAETFSRFLKAIHAKRGPKDYLRAYLFRIAHNWITDYYRRTPETVELKETYPSHDQTPEQETSLRMRQTEVRSALNQLTSDQQQVIALKYFEGWKNDEVARVLKKPVGAVKSLQHRALARLQKILDREE